MKDTTIDLMIIAYAITSKDLTLKAIDQIETEYLIGAYADLFKLFKLCFKKYNSKPTLRMLQSFQDWNEELEEIYNEASKKIDEIIPENIVMDIETIKERYNKKLILNLGGNIKAGNSIENINKTLKKTIAEIEKLNASKIYKEGSLKLTATEAQQRYENVKENPELACGVLLGLRQLDIIMNGLQPAELMLIGGQSGAGKSTLAMNMAINAWRGTNPYPEDMNWVEEGRYADDGHNVLYFTLEMPYDALRRRIDACLAGVRLYGLRDASLSPEEELRYEACIKFQKQYQKDFYIIDVPRGCSMAQIESKYMDLKNQFEPELVIIDYISLMKSHNENEADWLALGHLAESLHEFCRAYSIPCISPVQLNRAPQGQHKLPDQNRIGRSFGLPQNCNIMLNIDTREEEHQKLDMVINIAKMRDGEQTAFTLNKRLNMMRIYDDIPEDWAPQDYKEVKNGENETY